MALSRINSSMIGAGDVSNTEHAYLNSVSSNVQTQIDGAGVADVKFLGHNGSQANITGDGTVATVNFTKYLIKEMITPQTILLLLRSRDITCFAVWSHGLA